MDYNIHYREKDKGIQCIISYKVGGKWKQKSKQGFKSQREAKPWWQNEVKQLSKLNLSSSEYLNITFGKLYDIFIEHKGKDMAQHTITRHRIVREHFSDLGDMQISKIKTFDIQVIINSLEHLAPSSKQSYLKSVKAVFNFAINNLESLHTNPADKVSLPTIEKKNYLIVTKEEFYKDIYPLLQKRKDIALVYKIALSTGMRCGEILGITYDAIKSDRIIVDKQWNLIAPGKRGFKKLKTSNSYREVPISPELYRELTEYKKEHLHISKRLFYTINKSSDIRQMFNATFKNTKYEKLRLHDMRHSFVSILIEQGLDFKSISEIIGDTLETTMRIYSHMNSDSKERAKRLISNYF